LDLPVEGDEDGVVADGKAEKQRVRNLAMAVEAREEGANEFKPGWGYWKMGNVWQGGNFLDERDCIID